MDPLQHVQKLGNQWFHKVTLGAGHSRDWLDRNELLKACDRHNGILDDSLALSTYLQLYADDSGKHLLTKDTVNAFLEASLFLYLLDSWGSETEGDLATNAQIEGVLNALFSTENGQEEPGKDARQVVKYFEANLPNCVQHMHKFFLYRLIKGAVIGGVFTNRVLLDTGSVDTSSFRQSLDKFKMWQLSCILPAIPFFKSPVDTKPTSNVPSSSRRSSQFALTSTGDAAATVTQSFSVATWQLLYNGDAHGVGTNRFLHHVLGYRGPTVMLVLTKNPKTGDLFEFCLAQSVEWKEAMSMPFADKFAVAAELRHQFRCLGRQKVTPWIYYNMGTQRGQKKGLCLGEAGEPPLLSLDESFDNATYNKENLHVLRIEVWGCGTAEDRARQLDVKKWEVREAERQRVVKLSADDWLDHPDRYLLEMSGRQSYVVKEKETKK